jgi:hypothetical protein
MKTVLAFVLLLAGLAGCLALEFASAANGLPPPEGPVLLVVVPPWEEGAQIVAQAGGRIVGPDPGWLTVLAADATPEALRDAGAVMVADGTLAARLCGLQ